MGHFYKRGFRSMDHFGYLYACLLAAGGLAGYLKAGSLMSLLMGTLTGLGAGVGAYRASANPANVCGASGQSPGCSQVWPGLCEDRPSVPSCSCSWCQPRHGLQIWGKTSLTDKFRDENYAFITHPRGQAKYTQS